MKKIKKKTLINSFDRAISSALQKAVDEKSLLFSKDSCFVLGNLTVKKCGSFYKIHPSARPDDELYETVFLDNAIYIAYHHQKSMYTNIRELLKLERDYNKYDVDMMFYLHSYKLAKDLDDDIRRCSLEDRYYIAREYKSRIKSDMKRITKTFSKRINTRKYS